VVIYERPTTDRIRCIRGRHERGNLRRFGYSAT
jgi:hypothetical protein